MQSLRRALDLPSQPEHPFALAPLAGVTDSAFRRLCFRCGASLAYTEMVSAKGLYFRSKGTRELLEIDPEEGPVGIQLFASEPAMLEFAAGSLAARPNRFIDINMGCPVPKVVKNGEGSALLRQPELASELVRAAVKAAGKPVSVKMRIGFGADGADGFDPVAFALAMQDAGAAMIAVHGRTREQYYSGKADRSVIRKIKQALDIPVAGNGDVFCARDALSMLEETGCDMVLIARGALGNPWIFRECRAAWEGRPVPPKPDAEEITQTLKEHARMLLESRPERRAVRELRKHAAWYTKGIPGAAALRRRAAQAESLEEMFAVMEGLKEIGPRK